MNPRVSPQTLLGRSILVAMMAGYVCMLPNGGHSADVAELLSADALAV